MQCHAIAFWSPLAIRSIFRVIMFPLFCFFVFPIALLFLVFLSLIFVLHLSELLALCCACHIQYDWMAYHCRLALQHYDVVSLCRSFFTTELVSLKDERSARTWDVLDVDG